MARSNTYTVGFRRKRSGKTNYKTRLKLLSGGTPRIVIRKSLKNITAQVVEYNPSGDKVLFTAHSHELTKLGWKGALNNTPAAYLTGLLLASKVKEGNFVLDIGLNVSAKGSILYACLKGIVDGGLSVPCSDTIFPDDSRIRGEHIAEFAKSIKDNKELYEKQFSKYIKNGLDPEKLPEHFDAVKSKVKND